MKKRSIFEIKIFQKIEILRIGAIFLVSLAACPDSIEDNVSTYVSIILIFLLFLLLLYTILTCLFKISISDDTIKLEKLITKKFYKNNEIKAFIIKKSILNTVTIDIETKDQKKNIWVRGNVIGYQNDPQNLKNLIDTALRNSDTPIHVVVGR